MQFEDTLAAVVLWRYEPDQSLNGTLGTLTLQSVLRSGFIACRPAPRLSRCSEGPAEPLPVIKIRQQTGQFSV